MFVLFPFGGERGIRTLGRLLAEHTISRTGRGKAGRGKPPFKRRSHKKPPTSHFHGIRQATTPKNKKTPYRAFLTALRWCKSSRAGACAHAPAPRPFRRGRDRGENNPDAPRGGRGCPCRALNPPRWCMIAPARTGGCDLLGAWQNLHRAESLRSVGCRISAP